MNRNWLQGCIMFKNLNKKKLELTPEFGCFYFSARSRNFLAAC